MEITNFNNYLNTFEKEQRGEFFDFWKKKADKKKYDAQRYQKNKEKLKHAYQIKKKARKLGLSFNLIDGVFGGEPKPRKTQKDYNRNYYLKWKTTRKEINKSLANFTKLTGQHPLISKKENKEKNSDTKIGLRESGKSGVNILDILIGRDNRGKELKTRGRPRSQEAQKLGRPLTNAERQKRKRLKKILYINSKKSIINMVDDPNIRIETINKVPTKAGMKLKDWPNWWEKLTWPQLIDKNKEAGARTGKPVKYFKRWYKELICLDGDFWKYLGLNQEERELIHRHSVERQQKLGVGYNKTDGGQHDYYLFKENLKDIVIKWGDHRPAEILKLGRQFQFEGEGKEWIENQQHPRRGAKIVKNTWGFCQILNRLFKKYGFGYWVEEVDRWNKLKKTASNIKAYQPQEFQQNFQQLLKDTKLNQTIIIKEKVLNLTERRDLKTDKWREPWIARTDTFFFFFNTYYANQAKLLNYEGATMKLQLKRGTAGFHLNKVIAVCQH